MHFSIIVPVLNEAVIIRDFLEHLRAAAADAEIIVVDGGSTDATAAICRAGSADRVISATACRGGQMNAGAAVASGDVLWFVHADSQIPDAALPAIEKAMRDGDVAGGCFRLVIIPRRWIYRIRDAVGNVCVDLFHIALGDRGLFVRRANFLAISGYPNTSLLEDAEMYCKLRRTGKTLQLKEAIRTSARRYEAQGPVRTCLFYGFVMILYAIGLPIRLLERLVRRFMSSKRFPGKFDASTKPLAANYKKALVREGVLQFNRTP